MGALYREQEQLLVLAGTQSSGSGSARQGCSLILVTEALVRQVGGKSVVAAFGKPQTTIAQIVRTAGRSVGPAADVPGTEGPATEADTRKGRLDWVGAEFGGWRCQELWQELRTSRVVAVESEQMVAKRDQLMLDSLRGTPDVGLRG